MIILRTLLFEHMTFFAIETLFKEHFRCAVYTAQSIVLSREVAEDIVQNVFIKLLDTDISSVKYPASFLYTCVRHAALDYVRNNTRAEMALEELKSPQELSEVYGDGCEYFSGDEAEHLERVRKLFSAIEQLPPKTRDVVKMVYLEGYSYREAAEVLSVSLATVKSHMYQSFKMLREKMTSLDIRKSKKIQNF